MYAHTICCYTLCSYTKQMETWNPTHLNLRRRKRTPRLRNKTLSKHGKYVYTFLFIHHKRYRSICKTIFNSLNISMNWLHSIFRMSCLCWWRLAAAQTKDTYWILALLLTRTFQFLCHLDPIFDHIPIWNRLSFYTYYVISSDKDDLKFLFLTSPTSPSMSTLSMSVASVTIYQFSG